MIQFKILFSSIFKKLLMSLTGLCFILFLFIHILGNTSIFGGQAAFNKYVHNLHSLGIFISLSEIILLIFFITHVLFGTTLFIQNQSSRPKKYYIKKNDRLSTTWAQVMPYTGFLLLFFLIIHLINFRFQNLEITPLYQILTNTLSNPINIIFYSIAVIILSLHIGHGFWSAFQTLGLNHPKYIFYIKSFSYIISIFVGISFLYILFFIYFIN